VIAEDRPGSVCALGKGRFLSIVQGRNPRAGNLQEGSRAERGSFWGEGPIATVPAGGSVLRNKEHKARLGGIAGNNQGHRRREFLGNFFWEETVEEADSCWENTAEYCSKISQNHLGMGGGGGLENKQGGREIDSGCASGANSTSPPIAAKSSMESTGKDHRERIPSTRGAYPLGRKEGKNKKQRGRRTERDVLKEGARKSGKIRGAMGGGGREGTIARATTGKRILSAHGSN